MTEPKYKPRHFRVLSAPHRPLRRIFAGGPQAAHHDSTRPTAAHRSLAGSGALGMVAASTAITLVLTAPLGVAQANPGEESNPTAKAAPAADGKSEATAAASCWEIKQEDPDAEDGVYWLRTPAMVGGPDQFYCDQTTDGGGWVLIGRGRENWSVANIGSGSPKQVRDTITGTAAFKPRQLSAELIDQLNNNEPISQIPDGVRLRRAVNRSGSQWQDFSFTFATARDKWTWQFENQQRIDEYTVDGQTYSGGTTRNVGDGAYRHLRTITGEYEGWASGFGYGHQVQGSNSADSYLWSKNSDTGAARPFTQVFLRPKLSSGELFKPIPEDGTAAVTNDPVAEPYALPQKWGVTGLGAGPSSLEGSNEVSAFAEVGSSVFVGGNFTTVQKDSRGGGAVNQSYLVSFDQESAELNTGFRPRFNNQVKALAALPNNRVAVGGYFTEVNGKPAEGLVVLNASTGQTDTKFTGRLINYLSSGVTVVRTLDVQGDWLYAGGSFTHGTGGKQTSESYSRGAARLNVNDGTPDPQWNPEFNATVVSLDASKKGDRTYFAGYFSKSRQREAGQAAAVTTTSSVNLIPWQRHSSMEERSGYQLAVLEVGNRVWLGGAEHLLASYARDDMRLLTTVITLTGGDFQSLASDGKAVYGGCHCFGNRYEGGRTWPSLNQDWNQVNAIYGSGAWNAGTGDPITQFNGTFGTKRGAGAWALFVDSKGVLWQGGDWSASTRPEYRRQWSSGFVRHQQADTQAPSKPADVKAAIKGSKVALTWSAATDNRKIAGYQVLRHDRVVATVTGTTATVPAGPEGTNYFVRAIDAAQNVSASSSAVTASAAEPEDAPVIAEDATWSYRYTTAAIPEKWNALDFADADWQSGRGVFGWGHTNVTTELDTDQSPRPITSYYRRAVNLDSLDFSALTLTTRADDGIVVYVNGKEVVRRNLDPGPVKPGTYANKQVSARDAVANPVTVDVPASAWRTGKNAVAVEVHSNYRSTPSHSFLLTAQPKK